MIMHDWLWHVCYHLPVMQCGNGRMLTHIKGKKRGLKEKTKYKNVTVDTCTVQCICITIWN